MELEQVFDYAIDQETQAKEFYERSAAQMDNAEASALFRSLARMEGAHKRALETEKRILTETGEISETKYEKKTPEAEMVESLKSMAQVLREANVELTSRHRRIEVELETAGQIQEALLPRTAPQLPGLDISVSCSMAAQVGGDYYDFMLTPRGHMAMTIADVSGKGLPAAMLMMAMRTLWRSKVREDDPPEQILNKMADDATVEFQWQDQFVTLLTAVYNIDEHTLTFANAGHWPPLIYLPKAKDFIAINAAYLPIGLDGSGDYEPHTVELGPESVVVFFSDGVIDAANPEGRRFGEERFRNLVYGSRHLSAVEIRDAVTTQLFEFSRGRQEDDETLMVMKRT
jgi:phosphoserine phosphatase RsbU/P